MAEERIEYETKKAVKSEYIKESIRHEIGHALLELLLTVIDKEISKELHKARENDLIEMNLNLTKEEIRELNYFIQLDNLDGGIHEAFAEVFADLYGGAKWSGYQPFKKSFKELRKLIKKTVQEIQKQSKLSVVSIAA